MSEKSEAELYGFWRSQATFRLRAALNLKGVAFRETPIDLDLGEQDRGEFRRINPSGSVPALVIDGAVLTQSLAILEYLEEIHPEPPLLPADPKGRARVRGLAAIAASDAHPLIVPRVKRFLAERAGFGPADWKAWQAHWFTAGLRAFEARLANDDETGNFCHGDQPTVADICLAGLRAGARTFAIEVGDIPTVERIVERCGSLRAFDAARAERQADYPG